MASPQISVVLKVHNAKAIRALQFLDQLLEDLAESQPWNQEVRKGLRASRYALANLVAKPVQANEKDEKGGS